MRFVTKPASRNRFMNGVNSSVTPWPPRGILGKKNRDFWLYIGSQIPYLALPGGPVTTLALLTPVWVNFLQGVT
jgi:hypothetical protein